MVAQPDSFNNTRNHAPNARLLREVIQRDGQRLLRQAVKHSQLPEDANDALQSAYLLFLERYDGRGAPLPWLYTTVKREAWAISRRASRRRERDIPGSPDRDLSELIPDDAPAPEARIIHAEKIAEQRNELAALKHDERKALWMFAAGFSYADICKTCGWSYTKVNRCIAEGRAALRAARVA